MNAKSTFNIIVVGIGNVGLPAVLNLASVGRTISAKPWQVFLVDYDRVEEKDVAKGYHPDHIDRYKAEAAAMALQAGGGESPVAIRPIVAAAESVPGLFRMADAVLNGTDSLAGAAYCSELSRDTFEIRLSTGMRGGGPIHSIEVLPPGVTLGDGYDTRAWADTSRRSCAFGTPYNPHAGIVQPAGWLTAALAVHLLQCRLASKDDRACLIQICGEKITQGYRRACALPSVEPSSEIDLNSGASLANLFHETAGRLGVEPTDVLLRMPIPLVHRECSRVDCGRVYRGFERQPALGRCLRCGSDSYCLQSELEILLTDVRGMADKALRSLYAPAGFSFAAQTRNGDGANFHLPFCFEDIPPLTEDSKKEELS